MSAAIVSTENLIAFLQRSASYPHCPKDVKIVQTHASVLAIAPPYVYKVKKHVDLGFMKLTTLEERKRNCERELQLNSRFCADLYLAILPIALKDNELAFGTGGEVVEYALQMNQLPDGYFMDQLLKTNKLTLETLDNVLLVLRDFYRKYASSAAIAAYGNVEAIKAVVEEDNLATLEQMQGEFVHPAALGIIKQFTHAILERHTDLFQKRVREQKIQDCHGDLHLEHIHIGKDKICIFDCIEFNDQFRYIDVASDIAFLAMDLDYHDRPDLALFVADRMAELLQDPDMKLLLDFYKCHRACVRAKVECIKAEEAEVPAAEKAFSLEKARKYISLALRYSLFGSTPTVLLVTGRIGSGKSTLARMLAQLLLCQHLNSDVIRKEKAGVPLYERSSPEMRERLYAREVSDEVYQTLLQQALAITINQHHVVLDATFGSSYRRAAFVQELEQQQVNYFFLEMQVSDDVIKERLAQRENQEQEVSDARLEDFELLCQSYEHPDEISTHRIARLNAEADIKEVLQKALTGLLQRNLLQQS